MATLQVFAANNTHSDPRKDRAAWKRGDIVAVYDDGVCKEPPSPNSKSVFLHIPGVSKAQVEKYLEQKTGVVPGEESRGNKRVLGRSRFKAIWSVLPNGVKRQLRDNREYTINNLAAARKYLRDEITGKFEG